MSSGRFGIVFALVHPDLPAGEIHPIFVSASAAVVVIVAELGFRGAAGWNDFGPADAGGAVTVLVGLLLGYRVADAGGQALDGEALVVLEGKCRGYTAGEGNRAGSGRPSALVRVVV